MDHRANNNRMNSIITLVKWTGAAVGALLVRARAVRLVLLCGGPAVLFCFPATGLTDTAGIATVLDGDTIEIHGQRIRLHGIDAPESGQSCFDTAGQNWRCGQQAALALQELIGRRSVTCDKRDVDQYGRIVGRCLVGELDINEWLVAQGLALAYRHYSRDYTPVTTSRLRIRPDRPAAACGPARSSRPGSGDADGERQRRPGGRPNWQARS
jgi:endonuclease YncB( thermonuclease family)